MSRWNPKAPYEACPKCGDDEGYYTKMQARGLVITRFEFDGSEAENGDMYEGLSYSGGVWAYCLACHKRIFRMED